MYEQNAGAKNTRKCWTCPVVFFEKVDGSPCDVADELILHLKVPAEALLLLIRVAPDDLVTHPVHMYVRKSIPDKSNKNKRAPTT